jgi:hypothetical protein
MAHLGDVLTVHAVLSFQLVLLGKDYDLINHLLTYTLCLAEQRTHPEFLPTAPSKSQRPAFNHLAFDF